MYMHVTLQINTRSLKSACSVKHARPSDEALNYYVAYAEEPGDASHMTWLRVVRVL